MAWNPFRRPTIDQSAPYVTRLEAEVKTLRESIFDGGLDPDAGLSSSGGGSLYFRRLSDTQRDFDSMTQERALQTVAWLVESNPIAKRIPEMIRDYIIGDGIEIRAQDDDDGIRDAMQDVIDRFWGDAFNQLDTWIHDLVREQIVYGELCLSTMVNTVDGTVRLGYIDPSQIVDVLLDGRDRRTPVVVAVRRPQTPAERDYYRIVHLDTLPTSPTFGRMVGVEDRGGPMEQFVDPRSPNSGAAITFAGACFFFPINKPTGAKRGRSDLLCLADWLDAIDQHQFGEIDRALLVKAFVWDVSFMGADATALEQYKKANPAPKPGSVRYHNEKVVWNAVTPDLKSHDAQILNDMLQSYVATGAGLPKTWLNGLMDANRATAAEMGEPAIKHLTARQRSVRHMIGQIVTFQLDQAEIVGRLAIPRRQDGSIYPKPWKFAVQMPEIRPKDQAAAATTAQQAVGALSTALADGAIDIDTYQEMVALLVGQFGIDVDLEQMRERIATDQAAAERKMALAPYTDGAGDGGLSANSADSGPVPAGGASAS